MLRAAGRPPLLSMSGTSGLAGLRPVGAVPRRGGSTVQPIHRTSCQGIPPLSASCLAEHLAALINGQAQECSAPADGCLQGAAPAGPPGGNGLIWVEGEPGLADGHSRGMIVVGHGSDPAVMDRSLVISYPLGAGDERQCLRAVSNALQKLGWLVVVSRCRETATGRANTAVLVNPARCGVEQRLLLAEPVQAARKIAAASATAWAADFSPSAAIITARRSRSASACLAMARFIS